PNIHTRKGAFMKGWRTQPYNRKSHEYHKGRSDVPREGRAARTAPHGFSHDLGIARRARARPCVGTPDTFNKARSYLGNQHLSRMRARAGWENALVSPPDSTIFQHAARLRGWAAMRRVSPRMPLLLRRHLHNWS